MVVSVYRYGCNFHCNTDLLWHEFGHILQARQYGSTYFYSVIAPASLQSAASDPAHHRTFWTEVEANTLSFYYFNFPNNWKLSEYPINIKYAPKDPILGTPRPFQTN